ncbi:C39 family peptidase [Rhodococcus triatomae]
MDDYASDSSAESWLDAGPVDAPVDIPVDLLDGIGGLDDLLDRAEDLVEQVRGVASGLVPESWLDAVPVDIPAVIADVTGFLDGAGAFVEQVAGGLGALGERSDGGPALGAAGPGAGIDLSVGALADSDGDGVSGNPEAWALDWFYQQQDGYCGPSAVAQIVAQYTGTTIDGPEEMVARALELGLVEDDDPNAGMTLVNIEALLEDQGVPGSIVGGSLADLATKLDEGYGVIAMVDSGEIWGTDSGGEDDAPDHVLVVAGIDQDRGVVILSDPGVSHGNQLEVPIEQFVDAWEDSDCAMLVADEPDDGLVPTPPAAVEADPRGGADDAVRRAAWALLDLRGRGAGQ